MLDSLGLRVRSCETLGHSLVRLQPPALQLIYDLKNKSMTDILMTENEKRRYERQKRVVCSFLELKQRYPTAAKWRLMQVISKNENISTQAVRNMLLKKGIVTKRIR
nr:MAG TPA: hypothetical protein [Caudoviricetes sp.]